MLVDSKEPARVLTWRNAEVTEAQASVASGSLGFPYNVLR